MTVNVARRTRRRAPASAAAAASTAESSSQAAVEPSSLAPAPPSPSVTYAPNPSPAFTPRLVPGNSMTIGEIDQTLFDCPKCGRPLALGARRCPGCSTRLVNGVMLAKASMFVAGGLVIGLLAGAGGGFLIGQAGAAAPLAGLTPLASGDPAVASADPSASAAASAAAPSATPAPSTQPTTNAIPPAVRAALVQAVGANDQLAAARADLDDALAARIFDATDVAQILRSVSAGSVHAEQLAIRIAGWTGSAEVAAQLGEFYGSVHDTASDGLVASVRNVAAYRAAALAMVAVLEEIPTMDAAVRAAAASAGVSIPASPGASTAP